MRPLRTAENLLYQFAQMLMMFIMRPSFRSPTPYKHDLIESPDTSRREWHTFAIDMGSTVGNG